MSDAPTSRRTQGLVVRGFVARAGARRLIGPLDLEVGAGEIVTVMGPSGVGKSTLIGFLVGSSSPALELEGEAWLNGERIDRAPIEARRVGVVFQDPLLFPHMSVARNLAFALPRGGDRSARDAAVASALEEVELAGFRARDPASLSGGQRARVALARTLLARPHALLLDEPFGKLDVALRGRIRDLTFDAARARGLPTILVTHDPADAEAAGGRIVELAARAEESE